MPTVQTIASNFVWNKKDLILAIATPATQAAYNSTKDIPILINAVTDPVVKSMDKPGTNVTGTSDASPINKQFELIKKLVPNSKKIGILYNTSEANVDVLYTPADNLVASSMSITSSKCIEKKIPLIGSEKAHVEAEGGTGLFHVKLKITNLLSDILVMIGLYSINLRIMWKANVPLFAQSTIFSSSISPSMTILENLSMAYNKGKKFSLSSGICKKTQTSLKKYCLIFLWDLKTIKHKGWIVIWWSKACSIAAYIHQI